MAKLVEAQHDVVEDPLLHPGNAVFSWNPPVAPTDRHVASAQPDVTTTPRPGPSTKSTDPEDKVPSSTDSCTTSSSAITQTGGGIKRGKPQPSSSGTSSDEDSVSKAPKTEEPPISTPIDTKDTAVEGGDDEPVPAALFGVARPASPDELDADSDHGAEDRSGPQETASHQADPDAMSASLSGVFIPKEAIEHRIEGENAGLFSDDIDKSLLEVGDDEELDRLTQTASAPAVEPTKATGKGIFSTDLDADLDETPTEFDFASYISQQN